MKYAIDCMSLPTYPAVSSVAAVLVETAAAPRLDARLGKLTCTINDCSSPNKPVFCVE